MKLNTFNDNLRKNILQSRVGLELETLRVTSTGEMAKTPPRYREGEDKTRDFAENQLEINTPVFLHQDEARTYLANALYNVRRQLRLNKEPEYLWPFSVPPVLHSDDDVPVAQFTGMNAAETTYREYLATKYGKRKMVLCGLHYNFSFSDEIITYAHEATGKKLDYHNFVEQLYLETAQKALAYGWIITALTAASPVVDGSYWDYTAAGTTGYCGMASIRNSEFGFWNNFSPVLDYSSANAYANSIDALIGKKLIRNPSELYIPVRCKPASVFSVERVRKAIDHLELRMIDLNPMDDCGVELWVLDFVKMFLLWCAFGSDPLTLKPEYQVQCYQNYKNAAKYDLNSANVTLPDGMVKTAQEAAVDVLGAMREFYTDLLKKITGDIENLAWMTVDNTLHCMSIADDKINNPEHRYAHILAEHCRDYAAIGLGIAKRNTDNAVTRRKMAV